MEPILKYPGAKWKIAEWIIERVPPHVGYVEPFFGSGAVFFNKQKSKIETIADLDGSIIRFFKTCREHPEELAYALSMTPWSREEFLRSDFCDSNVDDIEAARQFAVRCWQTFGARTHCKTGWRNTTARTDNPGPDNPKLWRRLPKIVIQVADRLLDAQIENRPAIEVIEHNNGALWRVRNISGCILPESITFGMSALTDREWKNIKTTIQKGVSISRDAQQQPHPDRACPPGGTGYSISGRLSVKLSTSPVKTNVIAYTLA